MLKGGFQTYTHTHTVHEAKKMGGEIQDYYFLNISAIGIQNKCGLAIKEPITKIVDTDALT